MAQPDLIITPFADSAVPGTIDPIPETQDPALPQRASWLLGFPGVTMTPLAAGGIPPRGQDFNGVLNALSQHIVWLGRGGQYSWDAGVAAAGGYPLGAILQKAGIDGFWLNTVEGNTTDPNAGGAGWVDADNETLPYANDTGAANAYVATYTPAISSLTTGQVVRFKASNANTGASTFNPNGLGARPIVTLTGSALPSGAITANGHVWLQYDAAIGGGSWVSLLSSPSTDTINAAVATVAAAATINLTTGAPNTSQIVISGSGATINGFTVAASRFFVVRFSGVNTIVDGSGILTQAGTNITTAPGDTCLIRATANNTVELLCYTRANLGSASLAANGYTIFPNGYIRQWGIYTINTSGLKTITLPISFPNAFLGASVGDGSTSNNTLKSPISAYTLSNFSTYIDASTTNNPTGTLFWEAWGY